MRFLRGSAPSRQKGSRAHAVRRQLELASADAVQSFLRKQDMFERAGCLGLVEVPRITSVPDQSGEIQFSWLDGVAIAQFVRSASDVKIERARTLQMLFEFGHALRDFHDRLSSGADTQHQATARAPNFEKVAFQIADDLSLLNSLVLPHGDLTINNVIVRESTERGFVFGLIDYSHQSYFGASGYSEQPRINDLSVFIGSVYMSDRGAVDSMFGGAWRKSLISRFLDGYLGHKIDTHAYTSLLLHTRQYLEHYLSVNSGYPIDLVRYYVSRLN
jgi:tRNA A-37 threonylcarbamoyl transferase component Bud32